MLNQVVIVGRLVKDPEVKELENGKKVSTITLAVPRSYKNKNGEYETDFLDCTLWEGIASTTAEYCRKGDIIGVKGRLQTRLVENENANYYKQELIAEKVTFLSSSKEKTNDTEKEI